MAEQKAIALTIDTREQAPWGFCSRFKITRAKLETGDYAITGMEDKIIIERKSLADLIGTLTKGRKRFYKELVRMKLAPYKCIIVEAGLPDVLLHNYRGGLTPSAVLGSTAQISTEMGIPVYFAGSRIGAIAWANAWLIHALHSYEKWEGKKENGNAKSKCEISAD